MPKYHQPKLGEPKLILASASPRRAELLREAGFSFEIRPSSVMETIRPGELPREFAIRMALDKALDVSRTEKKVYVLGADTIVCLGTRIFGKPRDATQAHQFLEELAGKTHDVITGYAIIEAPDRMVTKGSVLSRVGLKQLTVEKIASYVATEEPLDKAGAYAIQGIGKELVEKIEGSFTNVVGLPVEELTPILENLGLK
ncbi:MAG: nucleoside triphosphate pyrophosphatase [Deltaproteobacteria bacterium]|nr:nucleoside triphosphate pyrophosphatase [Deltaproteobacteria bacterium]